MLDWPGQTLDLFIRVVHPNGFRLSKSKRDRHFDWMTDAEVADAEASGSGRADSAGENRAGS
jgi:hypothetical protein